ncbi:divergent polysaccharide deacetylase family protein [Rhizobium oryzicola]|uniref:Divergent polysaccharide deacetylase family protein n=1 Tax=Rhizobium oryzicola TaxID=1232668 RepID=A0ABT8T2V9_9HYPH|nr:divergent polysaccharide deacetylase family protein [Rhizobium oryzicola]MDO1584764.1 divergent polysaccharide deacetylase family protein [Rhizobium oryzicola]
MGTDLYAPLGQNRKGKGKPPRRPSLRLAALALVAAAVLGFSFYLVRAPSGLEKAPPVSVQVAAKPEAAPPSDTPVADKKQPSQSSKNGANVERTVMDDGSVVTKFSPRPRDGSGPLIIDAQRIGQDPRMAAQPNDDLLEESPFGRLPIKGPDGLRPMDQYARPWSGARGNRIAIVVGGLGLSQTGTQRAIKQLPPGVTLAFAASGNSLQRWMQEARRSGHELLMQIPMEPFDYPNNDPGPLTLMTGQPQKENLKRLHEAMGRITNYTGIMNYLGARYLSNADALEPVLRDIGQRGLLFLDDGSSAQTVTAKVGKPLNVPHGFADLTLDTQVNKQAILRKLDDLERIAQRKGTAIAVASAFDETIDAVSEWVSEAEGRGIELVGVSALVSEANDN